MGEVQLELGWLGLGSRAPVAAQARNERVCSSVANAPSHAEYPHPRAHQSSTRTYGQNASSARWQNLLGHV